MSMLKVPVGNEDHIEGSLGSPVSFVEYGDYECPHCGSAYPIVKRVQRHFGKRLDFVFRNFPLTQIHRYAQAAAETAEFAASKGKFWAMHDLLFENQDRLGPELFAELASNLELDPAELQQALADGVFAARVRTDFTGGVRSGVNGTPTFFINGQRHNGPSDYESLVQKIDEALEAVK
jgi:protein-disulfide isomerase